jgi:glycosyltransferase involved in cell wall biosynthesis
LISSNKSIKVCILTSVHSSFDIRIFQKEAKSLVNAGYNVTLLSRHNKEEIVRGIKIVPLPDPKNRIERMTKTAWMVYRKSVKIDADIYHFHDPELIPIGLLLKHHGKRVVYDVHEDVPRQILSKEHILGLFRKPVSAFIGAIEAFSAKRFDAVVTATPFIDKRFLELGANVVNVNNYPISFESCPPKKLWVRKEKTVSYIGGISRIRGAFEMVEAIGKTPYKLLLAGNIESRIKARLVQMPGWRQVDALGFIDKEGVKAIAMRSMAGLVIFHPEPNHINAQPNKMFEYMSAGIPVIASNFPLWKKIIEETGCGICVDPLSTEEIADAIRWIVEHPLEAKRMGENGCRAVTEEYNWAIEAKKFLKLYSLLS